MLVAIMQTGHYCPILLIRICQQNVSMSSQHQIELENLSAIIVLLDSYGRTDTWRS
jgi:hypothetical protein